MVRRSDSLQSLVQVCSCGTVFPPDCLFCRKCGGQWKPSVPRPWHRGSVEYLEPYLRLWRQCCTNRRAEELGIAMQLLTWQVGLQLARDLRYWSSWAKGVTAARVRNTAEHFQRSRMLQIASMKAALKKWLSRTEETARQNFLVDRSRQRLVKTSLIAALHMLARNVRCRRPLRLGVRLGADSSRRRHQQDTLTVWSSWSFGRQRIRGLLLRATAVLALSLKSRAWQCWRRIVRSNAAALAALVQLSHGVGKGLVEVYYTIWQTNVTTMQRLRAVTLCADLYGSRRLLTWSYSRWHHVAEQWKLERHGLAMIQEADWKRTAVFHLQLWRNWVMWERAAYDQDMRSASQYRIGILIRYFSTWRTSVAASSLELERMERARRHDIRVLLQLAFKQWCTYFSRLHKKRRSPHVSSAALSVVAMRRRRRLRGWARVREAQLRSGRLQDLHVIAALRAFFVWGEMVRDRLRRLREAHVAWQRRRRTVIFGGLTLLWRAKQLERSFFGTSSERTAKIALREWNMMATETALRHQQCSADFQAGQRQRHIVFGLECLREAMLQRRIVLEHALTLVQIVQSVMERNHREKQSSSLQVWVHCVHRDREIDISHEQQGQAVQRLLAVRRWWKHSRRSAHKRSVHVICDKYRCGQLVQQTFLRWLSAHARLLTIADNVVLWMASVAMELSRRTFFEWLELTLRRRRCRHAAVVWLASRRRKVFWLWDLAIERTWRVAYNFEQTILGWQQLILTEWRRWAHYKVVQRRRNEIATEAVHQARQRRWIDQWCAAGRWDRLRHVAESWDEKTRGSRVLFDSFLAWQETVLTIFRAGVAADRVGRMHARFHFRSWRNLFLILSVRPRRLMIEALDLWRDGLRRSIGFREAYEKHMERFARRQRKEAIQWLDMNCRQGKHQRMCTEKLSLSYSRRMKPLAISWWRRWSLRQQQRKPRAGDGHALPEGVAQVSASQAELYAVMPVEGRAPTQSAFAAKAQADSRTRREHVAQL